MASRKGRPNKLTKAVKDRVEQAFNIVNGPCNSGLIKLAADHPAIFYSMVTKLIPQQASIDINHTIIDLTSAFSLAKSRIIELEAQRQPTKLLDSSIGPADDIVMVEPDSLEPGAGSLEPGAGSLEPGAGSLEPGAGADSYKPLK